MLSWNGAPYSFGVAVRCVRLAPNTAVPQSATTANTVPSSALPTGTLAPPLLRSSALRTPISMLGGAPIDPRRPDSFAGFASTIGLLARAVRLARTTGQMPSATTTATVASAPIVRTSASKVIPVEVSAARASPRGAIGESKVAMATAPTAPASPTARLRALPSMTNCRRSRPSATNVGYSSLSAML